MGVMVMRATGFGAAALGLTVFLTACGADTTDFRASAERFIESDRMASESGTAFTDAVCQEPTSTDAGTTFRCVATDVDGDEWSFDVAIVDGSNFQITGRHNS